MRRTENCLKRGKKLIEKNSIKNKTKKILDETKRRQEMSAKTCREKFGERE